MVLTDAEHVQANLVSQLDLLDQFRETPGRIDPARVRVDVRKCEYSDFHFVLL